MSLIRGFGMERRVSSFDNKFCFFLLMLIFVIDFFFVGKFLDLIMKKNIVFIKCFCIVISFVIMNIFF